MKIISQNKYIMSESEGLEINGGKLQDFTIDQAAGAMALSLGAIGTLLLVIWQSRCACRCRLGFTDKCYIFDCSREPPPVISDKGEEETEDAEDPSPPSGAKRPTTSLARQRDNRQSARIPADPEPEPEPEPEP